MLRAALVARLTELIRSRWPAHVLRVAVDGPDATDGDAPGLVRLTVDALFGISL